MSHEEKVRILVVHSNEEERHRIETYLEPLDCQIKGASSRQEIFEAVQHRVPDLIVIDIESCTVDGYETAQTVRNGKDDGSIPLLFLTNLVEKEGYHPRANHVEGIDLLRKPYFPFEILSRCRSLLNIKKYTEQLETAEEVLQSLALAVEARDPTTGNHCDRLYYRLSGMADLLGLGLSDRDTLLKGSILHDIGKVGVPDKVLLKEGPLTDSEWEVMRQHVVIGESLCRPLKFLHQVLPLIRHHHERYDGSGYPDGLTGDDIPLVARVFQVCDVFDALTHARPYKPAFTLKESAEILQRESDSGRWDKRIVEIFFQLVGLENSK